MIQNHNPQISQMNADKKWVPFFIVSLGNFVAQ